MTVFSLLVIWDQSPGLGVLEFFPHVQLRGILHLNNSLKTIFSKNTYKSKVLVC